MKDFRELAPCGGTFTLNIQTSASGHKIYQNGISQSSPKGAAISMIACDFYGNALKVVQLGWAPGQEDQIQPSKDHFITFLPSDTEMMFGHECPRCKGYWRSDGMPHLWPLTCPYCGLCSPTHFFLTNAHRHFLLELTNQLHEAINSDRDGDHDFRLDDVIQRVQDGESPPAYFYKEVSQQEKFKCSLCGGINDILGRFGYCSSCGYRNNIDCVANDLKVATAALASGGAPEAAIRNAVAAIEAAGRNYIGQLLRRVPMTRARRKNAEAIRFHDLDRFSKVLMEIFGVDVLKDIGKDDIAFATMMFHRRHVHEHLGSIADVKYIEKSGDKSVTIGQRIRENHENVKQFSRCILEITRNLQEGFHEILPVNETALKYLAPEKIAPSK